MSLFGFWKKRPEENLAERRPTPESRSEPVPQELREKFLDQFGQPANARLNSWRRNDRSIHELLGIVKGILADDVVCPAEVVGLANWLLANVEPDSGWPLDVVCARVAKTLEDGLIEQRECAELAELFREIAAPGGLINGGFNESTRLPLTDPPPPLVFRGKLYVLTGKFYCGTRRDCEQRIMDRGGKCGELPTKKTDVLVIGSIGSRDWIYTSYGRKIESAIDHIRAGASTVIVSEEHWARFL